MEQNESYTSKTDFTILEFCLKLLEKWYIVLAIVLVFVISAFVYVQFFCAPTYSSTAKLYICNTESNMQNTNEVALSTYFARDYAEIITDRTVLEEVISNLGLRYSYSSLKSAVSIENPTGTRILEISVQTDNPELSKNVADEICRVSQEKIVDLMGIDRVNIISDGEVSQFPTGPNKPRYVGISFLTGVVVSVLIVFVIFILNDKIESEEDIQKYLNMSVLATIPYTNAAKRKGNYGSAGKTK